MILIRAQPAMPDGFDPHVELERIYTLREMIAQCRQRLPRCVEVLDEALSHEDISVRLEATKIALDRGYGKPLRQVSIALDIDQIPRGTGNRRVLLLPDNERENVSCPMIDAEAA